MGRASLSRLGPVALRALVAALASLAVVAAFWIFWRHQVFPKRLVEIERGQLFRSGQIAPRLVRETLEDLDIGLVIDLQTPSDGPAQRAEQAAVEELGVEYLRLSLGGSGVGDPHHYALAIEAIERARREGRPALVHCAAGARRSGAIIAMYGLLVGGRTPAEAYRELDRFGSPPVAETPLVDYLNDNMAEIATELVALGVLERVPEPLPVLAP